MLQETSVLVQVGLLHDVRMQFGFADLGQTTLAAVDCFGAVDPCQLMIQVRIGNRLIHESLVPVLVFLYVHQTFLDVLLHFVAGLMIV